MQVFHPKGGTLEFEIFDNPKVHPEPVMTLTIHLDFSELMDPKNPKSKQLVSAEINGIPLPLGFDWRQLGGGTLKAAEFDANELTEGTIYYRGYHNPIELASLTFGSFQRKVIPATLKGVIDFTYEGLADLGKLEFEWHVNLNYEKSAVEKVFADFKSQS